MPNEQKTLVVTDENRTVEYRNWVIVRSALVIDGNTSIIYDAKPLENAKDGFPLQMFRSIDSIKREIDFFEDQADRGI